MQYERYLKRVLREAASDSPVVLLAGARQTGKSTLMKELFSGTKRSSEYITLDDLTVLSAALGSPGDFIANLPESVILDEVQRAPDLFLPIKKSIDENRKPGRFLMTGSAHVLSFPKIADSLAGRMEVYHLWPLSQSEVLGSESDFVSWAFSGKKPPRSKLIDQRALYEILLVGGYPESRSRESQKRRNAWFDGYLTTLLQRDVRDLSNIEGVRDLPRLLTLIASRVAGLLNHSDLSRSLSIPNTTLRRYLALLEAVFLVVPLGAWATNIGKRIVKSPKLFLNDTGLLCHLLGIDLERFSRPNAPIGPVLENFVAMELIKQLGWSETDAELFHFRTVTGQEVDFLLERRDGSIVGIEVKASRTLSEKSFSGLRSLEEATRKRFRRGVVLYTGDQAVSFGESLTALPISALWSFR